MYIYCEFSRKRIQDECGQGGIFKDLNCFAAHTVLSNRAPVFNGTKNKLMFENLNVRRKLFNLLTVC